MIERSSPTPYYEQLFEVLRDRVRTGAVERGERLPGESELHRDFGLSRATVRQALEMLEANGWAYKVPRRGYFAASASDEHGWLIEGQGGFMEAELGHANPSVRTRVVRAARGPLPDHATASLNLPRNAEGFILERVRHLETRVALFSTNFTPAHVVSVVESATGVLDGTSSLTRALSLGGFRAAGSRRVIHAKPASGRIAATLHVAKGTPLLRIRSSTWDESQQPFDYYETWLRSDVVPLELNASAHRTAPASR